jgi:hypothetical protein
MWGHGLDRAGSGWGQVAGTYKCGNETSGSLKCRKFPDWLRNLKRLRKDAASCTDM